MFEERVKCPICGGLTAHIEKRKKQLYICQNEECSTKLVVEKQLLYMEETKNKESGVWKKYRYKRITLGEMNSIAEGQRIPDKEHREFGFDKESQEALQHKTNVSEEYKSKKEGFAREGILCPFSWIEVTKPAGCLSSMFGGKDKLVWEAQPCMASKCKLWDSSEENCGLVTKKS